MVVVIPRRKIRRDPWWRFVACTLAACAGLALAYGALTPEGFATDEPAHAAYADEIRSGRLPDVDTLQPEHEARRTAAATRGDPVGEPRSLDYIYVANHPPAFAATQAAITATLDGTGVATDATVAVGRFLNALCMVGSVLVLALIGREVTGRLRIGALSAALFASVPALWSLATFGYSDGAAVLVVSLATWAGVVAWKDGTTRSVGMLGATVAAAGAVRATALLAALAVAAVVCVRQLSRHRARGTSPHRWRARVLRDLALVSLPALVLSSWWYVRMWIRFGDPTASEVLQGRLDRQPRDGGIGSAITDVDMWQSMVTQLTATAYAPNFYRLQVRLAPTVVWLTGLVALMAAVGLVVPRLAGHRWRRVRNDEPPQRFHGTTVLLISVGAVLFGVAAHVATGGAPHERYLLLAMPTICLAVVIGLDRIDRRLPLAALAGAAAASLWMLAASTRWVDDLRDQLGLSRFGPVWVSTAGAALAVVATLLAVAAAAVAHRRPEKVVLADLERAPRRDWSRRPRH